MADESQIKILDQGVSAWNNWRVLNKEVKIDLSGAKFRQYDYSGINFSNANLEGVDFRDGKFLSCNFSGARLNHCNMHFTDLSNSDLNHSSFIKATLTAVRFDNCNLSYTKLNDANLQVARCNNTDFRNADLSWVNLHGSELYDANFSNARIVRTDFREAKANRAHFEYCDLSESDLGKANFTDANLSGAYLQKCSLVQTVVEGTILTGCRIFGISVWGLKGKPKDQKNLVITYQDKYYPGFSETKITVDDLKIAQFIHLILNNKDIRDVIDSITTKVVLILGRFTNDRKLVLDAIHKELRGKNYLPVLFDFKGPENRDITETITTLAHLAKFIIADITDAKSIPQELQAIVPFLPSVPVLPMLEVSQTEYGMFAHFKRYPWVLETYCYKNIDEVILTISENVLTPLENKLKDLIK